MTIRCQNILKIVIFLNLILSLKIEGITKRDHPNLSKNVIIGLLVNGSWSPYNDSIKLIHYRRTPDISKTTHKCDLEQINPFLEGQKISFLRFSRHPEVRF